jgi:cold shock CspA family protein
MTTVVRRRRVGTVVYLNHAFGRILRADTGKKVFFHRNQVERHFREGDRVTFVEEHNAEWGDYAADIRAAQP